MPLRRRLLCGTLPLRHGGKRTGLSPVLAIVQNLTCRKKLNFKMWDCGKKLVFLDATADGGSHAVDLVNFLRPSPRSMFCLQMLNRRYVCDASAVSQLPIRPKLRPSPSHFLDASSSPELWLYSPKNPPDFPQVFSCITIRCTGDSASQSTETLQVQER